MGRGVLVCGIALLALAGCSKGADKAAATGGQPAAPAAAAGDAAKSASADLGGFPSRKGGLWEQTMAFNGMKQTLRMCVDAASEQKARWWTTERRGADGGMDCSEQKVSRNLTGGWTIHSVCKERNGMTVTSDGTVTGDFGDHYHMEMTTVTTGSSIPQANGTHHMIMDGAWKGACPAGMAAGDVEMPGGMRMNTANPGAPTMAGLKPGERPSKEQIEQLKAMAEKMKAGAQ
jgi:hypothetical protein